MLETSTTQTRCAAFPIYSVPAFTGNALEGFLTNALNPKVSKFYLAAFPQFISIGETSAASAYLLVFLHSMINAIWFSAMVLLFSKLTGIARNSNFQRWLKGATGVVFIGFGAKLASYKLSL